VLAVDGNSLAHRAYHAISGSGDDVGHFVTGGVVAMLGTAWAYGPFDGVVVAFDGRDNRRKVTDPEYKAGRVDDPELRTHLDTLEVHLGACGLHVVSGDGIEADDWLAATARACTGLRWRCSVLSSDRDLTALVGDLVTLLRPRASMADLRVEDPPTVERDYGVRPDQYTDLAALRGDPSDGLAGVAGIGPKTAARLLRDHGDLDGIYANLCLLPPKVEAALRRGRRLAERNRRLMTPLEDLSVDVSAAVTAAVDPRCFDAALTPLGLGASAGRFRAALSRPPAPPRAPAPSDHDVPPAPSVPDAVLTRRSLTPVGAGAEQHALF
jgi:DNA polymerase-1